MERLTLDDMIKALKCVASQDTVGDCYADHENFMHMHDKHKRIVCETGEDLRDYISGKEAIGCPYHQNTYGCCFEDGELYWLKDVAELLEELKSYKDLEEQCLLVRLPCKVGDHAYKVNSYVGCDNDKRDDLYSSVHCFNCKFEKEFYYIQKIKFNFDNLDDVGRTIFITKEEAEKKLEEMKK